MILSLHKQSCKMAHLVAEAKLDCEQHFGKRWKSTSISQISSSDHFWSEASKLACHIFNLSSINNLFVTCWSTTHLSMTTWCPLSQHKLICWKLIQWMSTESITHVNNFFLSHVNVVSNHWPSHCWSTHQQSGCVWWFPRNWFRAGGAVLHLQADHQHTVPTPRTFVGVIGGHWSHHHSAKVMQISATWKKWWSGVTAVTTCFMTG